MNQVQTVITQPDPPCALCVTTTPVLCYGSYANLTANANFGVAPYKYSINNTSYQTSNVFRVKAGSYTMYVKDIHNTIQTVAVTVIQPAAFTFAATPKPVSCFGYTDGCVTMKYTGGTRPFIFKTDNNNPITDTVACNLAPASYLITAQDANGCMASKTVKITEPAQLNAMASATTITCYNNTAFLTTTSTGGTGSKIYSFDNINFHTAPKVTVKAGNYTITVKDSKGCTVVSNTVTVTQPALLTAQTTTQTNATCKGGTDGSVRLAAVGGTAPYQYSIDDIHYQSSGYFTNLKAATYTFRIIDSNKCKAYYNVIITQPATACNSARIAKASGNNINDDALAVTVFPNPSPGDFMLIFKTDKVKTIQVRIVNIYGKTVYNNNVTGNKVLHLGNELAQGIYIAEVIQDNNRKTFKLIKSK